MRLFFKSLVYSLFVLYFVQTQAVWSADSEWNVRDHIPLEDFIIQAHRGFGSYGPEGSDESFRKAWSLGFAPEADLRLTRDGKIVSFHDNDFRRILPNASEEIKKKNISDLTLAEVKKLDVGAYFGPDCKGQRALSLEEIVLILKDHPKWKVYLDIKKVDFDLLAQCTQGVHNQLIVASSIYNELLTWKKVAPNSHTIHWMGGSDEKLTQYLDELKKKEFYGIDQLQIHVHMNSNGTFSPSEDFLRKTGVLLRQYGVLYQMFLWGAPGEKAENYYRLMNLGAASFATDAPMQVKKAVKDYYSRQSGDVSQ